MQDCITETPETVGKVTVPAPAPAEVLGGAPVITEVMAGISVGSPPTLKPRLTTGCADSSGLGLEVSGANGSDRAPIGCDLPAHD